MKAMQVWVCVCVCYVEQAVLQRLQSSQQYSLLTSGCFCRPCGTSLRKTRKWKILLSVNLLWSNDCIVWLDKKNYNIWLLTSVLQVSNHSKVKRLHCHGCLWPPASRCKWCVCVCASMRSMSFCSLPLGAPLRSHCFAQIAHHSVQKKKRKSEIGARWTVWGILVATGVV